MIGWLLWCLCAFAEPADALDDLTRGFWDRGQRLEAQGDHRGAALAYRMTFQRAPTWTKAVLAEGRVLADAGETDAALRAYDRAPFVPDVMEARGRLLLAVDRPEDAAAVFRDLRRLALVNWPEIDLLLADALSRFDPQGALEPLQSYLGHRSADLDAAGAVPTARPSRSAGGATPSASSAVGTRSSCAVGSPHAATGRPGAQKAAMAALSSSKSWPHGSRSTRSRERPSTTGSPKRKSARWASRSEPSTHATTRSSSAC